MANLIFITIIYTTLVLLGGIMSFWHGDNIYALIAIGFSLLLYLSIPFILKRKKFIHIVITSLSGALVIYYGIYFYLTTAFFYGIMTATSAFFTFKNGIEIFKAYSKP